jgi:streptogramin lyase
MTLCAYTLRSTNASIRYSPYLLAAALSPMLLQTSTPLSCEAGDTTLSELEIIVEGENQIVHFDPSDHSYRISLPSGTPEARVRAVPTDSEAQLWVDVLIDGERLRYLSGGLGGADLAVPLQPGSIFLEIWVGRPGGPTDSYDLGIAIGIDICDGLDCEGGLALESCQLPQTDGGGVALSIDVDASGDAWVLGEFHTAITHVANDDPCTVTRITIPTNGFLFQCNGRSSNTSILGESIEVADDGMVWFTQGGGHLSENGVMNHSRVGRFDPVSQTFQMYNIQGDRNEAVGLWVDETRGWIWITEAGFHSDTTTQPPPHQGAIMAFDPETAVWNNALSSASWKTLDAELCGAGEDPTDDGCLKRYALPAATWTALQRGAFWPAHLVGDTNGDIWFTSFWGTSIGRLEPDTETVTIYPLPDARHPNAIVGSGPWAIEISPDGEYVVFDEYFDSTISRFDRSRADDSACLSLDGSGSNPCVEEMEIDLDLASQNIHGIFHDGNGRVWFAEGTALGTPAGTVQSRLGFVRPDWSGYVTLDPADVTPSYNPKGDISYAGVAYNPINGEIWAVAGPDSATYAVQRLGR